jgi:chromosomal replication initiation ATPase DnaA
MRQATGIEDLEIILEVDQASVSKQPEYTEPIFNQNQIVTPTAKSNVGAVRGDSMNSLNLGQSIHNGKSFVSSNAHNGDFSNNSQTNSLYQRLQNSGLNPRYNFANFIVGKHNQLASAAAKAIVDKPGFSYNPLFLYGNVGLGKTHLMQAIGQEILKNSANSRILYVPAETFLNEMIGEVIYRKKERTKQNFIKY